ncbi:uncharacterized protein L969DRAFT_624467 [Mixia osmundae IAM 14324]|uniref:MRH domain-containing protein n=1 Tax=Mixia osmundae (strain CBS 9802 / IAM 14324 / JCM 22182 / KY 12970) TaxID=764103 RepID=G7E145_MIXOS|nr:uncharacterized protein L969DRAFT_624467 [Mixia osmundae IAM 14324]KEI38805.1 hypothetical protein L969DRAFT_624467 [Mixia osmundae IAM 14324]GAA96555.1 hypothetical protein E5Q_03224 [Mixia osmundae IAM 14324]
MILRWPSIWLALLTASSIAKEDEAWTDYAVPFPGDAADNRDGDIKLNICHRLLTETISLGDSASIGAYRYGGKTGISLGRYNTTPVSLDKGLLVLEYTGGSECPAGGLMSSSISLVCDPGEYDTGAPKLVSIANGCSYFFIWRTRFACPTRPPRGFFGAIGILLTVIVISIPLAIGVAFAYNRLVLHRSDGFAVREIVPSLIDGINYVKDIALIGLLTGIDLIMSGFQRLRNGEGWKAPSRSAGWSASGPAASNYTAWSSSAEETTSLFDDEEEHERDEPLPSPAKTDSNTKPTEATLV